MFCYDIGTVDWFHGTKQYRDHIKEQLEDRSEYIHDIDTDVYISRQKDELFMALSYLAHTRAWEMDIRGENLYVGGFPSRCGDPDLEIFYILKQDNNGSTFMIAPFELNPVGYDAELLAFDPTPLHRAMVLKINEIVNAFCTLEIKK